jgi:hypothetical protein
LPNTNTNTTKGCNTMTTNQLQPQPPQAAPVKKKRGPVFWVLLIVGALVALVLFGSCVAALSGGSSTTEGAPATSAPAEPKTSDPKESAKPDAKIGERVTDGELRFVSAV